MKYLPEKLVKKLSVVMHYICNLSVEFVRKNCHQPVQTGPSYLVHNFLQILDTFLIPFEDEEVPVPSNMEEIGMNAIIFSAIWGFGGSIDEITRPVFDEFLKKLIAGENVQSEYKIEVED